MTAITPQSRRLQAIKLIQSGLTYVEVGRRMGGISRQRVCQLVADPSYKRDARARRLGKKRSLVPKGEK